MAHDLTEMRGMARAALELPVMGFGSAQLGELYARVGEADSQATLAAAWDSGVRYYDTAPWYGRGIAEHRMGGFLRTCERSDFIISTKVGRVLHRPDDPAHFDRGPWVGGLNLEIRFDYTYDGFMRSYEQSLMRLGLDTVDALIIHDLDAAYHQPDEVYVQRRRDLVNSGMRALEELKAAGQVKAIGMGVNTNEGFEVAVPEVLPDFLIVAMPYTLLDQDSLHRGMEDCLKRKVSVVVGAPYASGILVTGSGAGAHYAYGAASPDVQARVQGIERVAAAHGVALPAAALQFVLAHPAVVSVIPGPASAEQLRQNVGHLRARIPLQFWADLKTEGLIAAESPVPGHE